VIGRTLSHYQIVERIAAGGMGVVYRARDLRLKRDVALKVLPPETLADEKSRHRFRREALTLSRLNHPHVGTIFDSDSQEGVDFLVMEYVAGPWLEDRLRGGPLPEGEVLRIGAQIADALEAAHHEGVIHRDLKPANIGLTPDGHVKVLDFGLARFLKPVSDDSTTESGEDTRGMAGTIPYMAPEQLLGTALDARVDIFALGVILYRMSVGHLPFDEKNSTALANQILNADPPAPMHVNPRISPRLQEIILRCLEKDPAYRYQTASDLKADLNRRRKELESGVVSTRTKPVRTTGGVDRTWVRTAAYLGVAIVVVVVALLVFRGKGIVLPIPRYTQMTFIGNAVDPALSPDGTSFAYVDQTNPDRHRVMIRDIREGRALEVFASPFCRDLRWSPDGSAILCWAQGDSTLQTYVIPRLGGSPRIFPVAGVAHAWSPDGMEFVSLQRGRGRITVTDTRTGASTNSSLGNAFTALDVDWSPTESLLVLQADGTGTHDLWTLRPSGALIQKVLEEHAPIESPRWSHQGDAVYFLRANGSTMELCRLAVTPEGHKDHKPAVLLSGIQPGSGLSFSRDDKTMLYGYDLVQSNLWLFERREGSPKLPPKVTRLTTGTGFDGYPSISPDGRSVAFVRGRGTPANLVTIPIRGGDEAQLTFSSSMKTCPSWSPGGDEIAFESNEGGPWRVWTVNAHGGPSKGLEYTHPAEWEALLAWAPGRQIAYQSPGRRSLVAADVASGIERGLVPFDSAVNVMTPQWSPDGERLAFLRWWSPSRAALCVRSVRDSSTTSVHEGVPGFAVGWSRDGRSIYVWDPQERSERISAIPTGGGAPRTVMDIPITGEMHNPVITPDGAKAVASVITHQKDAWLVQNFQRDVK